MNGTMEITTKIGCTMRCKYCPQSLLIREYTQDSKRPIMMSMDTFKQCIDKIPDYITIDFSGMCEPWLNPQCTDMVEYAAKAGHPIRIFTTLVGMTMNDIERLGRLEVEQLVLHLPDAQGNASIPVDADYIKRLSVMIHTVEARNKGISCHGTLAQEVVPLIDQSWNIGSELIDRAGNLELEDIKHQEIPGEIFCDLCGFELNHNVLLPDGSVVLCCMDYGLKHVLGNLCKRDYKEIMTGSVISILKGQLQSGNRNILCHSCSNARSVNDLMKLYFHQKDETFDLWCEVNQQNHEIFDLKKWCGQLESGKKYLEQQVVLKEQRINELEQWTKQLEDAKAYLEEQTDLKAKRIAELEDWSKEVTSGKNYVETQWKHTQHQQDETQKKLDTLLKDDKIKKIIRKKGYEI